MSQTKSKMGLQPTLYQVQLKYLLFALAVIVYSPGLAWDCPVGYPYELCVENYTAFTDADNDLVVPPGAEEIQFAYTKPPAGTDGGVLDFELGSAGPISDGINPVYSASRAFSKEPTYNYWDSDHGVMCRDGLGMHYVGQHKSIFFRFNQPQTVVRIAFGSEGISHGPTKFSVFASNAENCLDESQWTMLKVVNDNKLFPEYPLISDGKRVKNLPVVRPFQCYGIQVRQIPAYCKRDPATSKLTLCPWHDSAMIKGIQMWTIGKDCKRSLKGEDYRGQISITQSGKTCQAWSETGIIPSHYPLAGVTSNYCRNPNSAAEPWCFSDWESNKWEHCGVPFCKGYGTGAAACDVAGKLVPHEIDCAKFYVCTGHGSGFPSKCKGGLQFNKNIETCDSPNNVRC